MVYGQRLHHYSPGCSAGSHQYTTAYRIAGANRHTGTDRYPRAYPDTSPTPTQTPAPAIPNGVYKINVTSSAFMFRVVDCQLTSKDGVMTAILTLSGVGYDYLFMGTKEEADQADRSTWIPFTPNAAGKYTYPVPVLPWIQALQ